MARTQSHPPTPSRHRKFGIPLCSERRIRSNFRWLQPQKIETRSGRDESDERWRQYKLYRQWSRVIIAPKSRLKFCFDLIVLAGTLWVTLTMPIKTALGLHFGGDVDTLVDILFFIDVILTFFHGFSKLGYDVMEPIQISRRYIQSRWFYIDALAALPFDRLTDGNFRVLSLVKAIRLLRLRQLLGRYSHDIRTSIPLRVALTIFAQIGLAHFSACTFYAIGYYSVCSFDCAFSWDSCRRLLLPHSNERRISWILVYWPELDTQEFCQPGAAVRGGGEELVSASTRYVHALGWAFATTSSLPDGSLPGPVTNGEVMFACMCNLFGGFFIASIIGNVSSLLMRSGAQAARYQEQHDHVRAFAKAVGLSQDMRERLYDYVNFGFSLSGGYDVNEIMHEMPLVMQRDVNFELYEPHLRKVSCFHDVTQEGFFRDLAQLVKQQVVVRHDFVFFKGEVGARMYFVRDGVVDMLDGTTHSARRVNTKVQGDYFGELAIILPQARTASAWARMNCVLLYVAKTDFQDMLAAYPDANKVLIEHARDQLKRSARSATQQQIFKPMVDSLEARADRISMRNSIRSDESTVDAQDDPDDGRAAADGGNPTTGRWGTAHRILNPLMKWKASMARNASSHGSPSEAIRGHQSPSEVIVPERLVVSTFASDDTHAQVPPSDADERRGLARQGRQPLLTSDSADVPVGEKCSASVANARSSGARRVTFAHEACDQRTLDAHLAKEGEEADGDESSAEETEALDEAVEGPLTELGTGSHRSIPSAAEEPSAMTSKKCETALVTPTAVASIIDSLKQLQASVDQLSTEMREIRSGRAETAVLLTTTAAAASTGAQEGSKHIITPQTASGSAVLIKSEHV